VSALASVVAKLALIVPRLGSPYDGEVIASARAIGRTLQSAGCDWHDLSAMIVTADRHDPEWHGHKECAAPIWVELNPVERRPGSCS
jgi:hypothetical protein